MIPLRIHSDLVQSQRPNDSRNRPIWSYDHRLNNNYCKYFIDNVVLKVIPKLIHTHILQYSLCQVAENVIEMRFQKAHKIVLAQNPFQPSGINVCIQTGTLIIILTISKR